MSNSTSIVIGSNGILDIGIDEKKLEKFCSNLGIKKIEHATTEEVRSLFLAIIESFKKGETSLDSLSAFADYLRKWESPQSPQDKELQDILMNASDLNYELRSIRSEADIGNNAFSYDLVRVMKFFEKYGSRK